MKPTVSGISQLGAPPRLHSAQEEALDMSEPRYANPRGYANPIQSAYVRTGVNKIVTRFVTSAGGLAACAGRRIRGLSSPPRGPTLSSRAWRARVGRRGVLPPLRLPPLLDPLPLTILLFHTTVFLAGYMGGSGSAACPLRFCRKVRFLGKIQKLGIRNSMTYRCQNSRKSNFATEPSPFTRVEMLNHKAQAPAPNAQGNRGSSGGGSIERGSVR